MEMLIAGVIGTWVGIAGTLIWVMYKLPTEV